MSFLTPELTKETDIDVFGQFDRRETPFGEYFGAKLDEGFDFTTSRMMVDEDSIARAEKDEYGVSKSFFWGGGNPYDPITQNDQYRAHKAKRNNVPLMNKEEWEKSEFYRPGMEFRDDMTGVRARYMSEAFDKRRYRDSLIQRSPDGFRNVAGFVGQLLGNVPDLVNFIPFGLAGKGGSAAVRVGAAAAEGVVSTAVADAIILPDLAERGEAVGWQDAATDIFFGALIGGAGGWGGHKLHQRRVSKLKNSLLARHRDVHARAAEKAMADLAAGEPVDVSAVYRSSEEGMQAFHEAQTIARAYDDVSANPMGGPADEVLATIKAKDIERILIERGPAVEKDGQILVHTRALESQGTTAGTGLVKIIWKHGEKSTKASADQVTRADVVSLPEFVRRFLPSEENSRQKVWRIPRGDGRQLVIVASKYVEDGKHRLVSMHAETVGKGYNPKKKPSKSRPGAFQASGGYTQEGSRPTTEARGSRTESSSAVSAHTQDTHGKGVVAPDPRSVLNQNIGLPEESVNWTAGKGEDVAPVELPQTKEGELEAMGLDKDGKSAELDAIMEMIERDELDFEEMKAIERVFDEFEATQRLEGAGLEIINCVLEAVG